MACLANAITVRYLQTAAHQVRLQPARSRPHASQPVEIAFSKVCGCPVAIRGIPRCVACRRQGQGKASKSSAALCAHALGVWKIHTDSLETVMQLSSHSGLEDLLVQRVVPELRLQDLQSLTACCRCLLAFVGALSHDTWLGLAR